MPLTAFLSRCIYSPGDNPDHPTWDNWTLDFEIIHQLCLKALFEDDPAFLGSFLNLATPAVRVCRREEKGQLYDLVVDPGPDATFFEIKVESKLKIEQIERQVAALIARQQVHYIILGQQAPSWTHSQIAAHTNGRGQKIGYKEIIASLARSRSTGRPIAEAYGIALEQQRQRIFHNFGDPDV